MSSLRWLWFMILAVLAAYWKLLLPGQFSLLLGYESTNQAYAWDHFFAYCLHHGTLPLWDPWGHCGRNLAGEMQTAPFYPLKLILYLWPFNAAGHLSPQLFNAFYLLTAVLGAWFMFQLARDLGLRPFAAYFAGVTFAVGGFVGRIVWPHMHDCAIWIPVLMLFAGRALRARDGRTALQYASAAGLALGMTVLAGGLHYAIMQALAVAGLCAYFGARGDCPRPRAAVILLTIGAASAAASAIQLWPSIEYSPIAQRYLGGSETAMAGERIGYHLLTMNYLPRALWGFLIGYPFGSGFIGTGEIMPYIGALPLLLAIAGVWRNWSNPWVRYLTALAGVTFYYTLGEFSILHGVAYTFVPFLWMAREPARFVYLVHFAMALLAGFGVQTLFESPISLEIFHRPLRILGWIVAGAAIVLSVPAFVGQPAAAEWGYIAFFQFLCAFGLLVAVIRHGWRSTGARFLLVALTLGDLSITNYTIRNIKTTPPAENYFQAMLDSAPLAAFLKAQPGMYRAHWESEWPPSLGEVYNVPTTGGMAATAIRAYEDFVLTVPHGLDMLSVRYLIRPATAPSIANGPGPIYSDARWKVYQAVTAVFPRAWMPSQVLVEPSQEKIFERMKLPAFEAAKMVLVEQYVESPIAPPQADISWEKYDVNSMTLHVRASTPGLLVLNDVYYPGWHARLNGKHARILRVNGLLRGVVVPAGDNELRLYYAPLSVYGGGAITLLCFAGVGVWFMRRRPTAL